MKLENQLKIFKFGNGYSRGSLAEGVFLCELSISPCHQSICFWAVFTWKSGCSLCQTLHLGNYSKVGGYKGIALFFHPRRIHTKFPKQWQRFLCVPENKHQLNITISSYLLDRVLVPKDKMFAILGGSIDGDCRMQKGFTMYYEWNVSTSRPTLDFF